MATTRGRRPIGLAPLRPEKTQGRNSNTSAITRLDPASRTANAPARSEARLARMGWTIASHARSRLSAVERSVGAATIDTWRRASDHRNPGPTPHLRADVRDRSTVNFVRFSRRRLCRSKRRSGWIPAASMFVTAPVGGGPRELSALNNRNVCDYGHGYGRERQRTPRPASNARSGTNGRLQI